MVAMKVTGNCLQWQHSPGIPHPKSLSLNRAVAITGRSLSYKFVHREKTSLRKAFSTSSKHGSTDDDQEFIKWIQQLLQNVKSDAELLPESVDAGESAFNKAFSSMVFIVRELHSYTLQMREALFFENLQGIIDRVQGEMNASFVWLFQQIFSSTPTLMVYVMLLLANFTVRSMDGSNYALAASITSNPTVQSEVVIVEQRSSTRIDDSVIRTFSVGRTVSADGRGGGGSNSKPVAGGTDDSSYYHSDCSSVVIPEEEAVVWNRMVEETTRMQATTRDGALMDHDTMRHFVSPVMVEVEPEDYEEHSRMEMAYHRALAVDPDNSMLLSNFAQFLFLVLHDHDRAEYYFKRAVGIKPADAESLSRYAGFLWLVRKDMVAAEETYLESIAAEPSNPYYPANYAHFLWNTGGEDTCYPIDDDH